MKKFSLKGFKNNTTLCAAVRAGRIEDLKRMTLKAADTRQKSLIVEKTPTEAIKPEINKSEKIIKQTQPINLTQIEVVLPKKSEIAVNIAEAESINLPPKIAQPTSNWQELPKEAEEIVYEEAIIIEDIAIMPAEAVEIIVDVVNSELRQTNELSIKLLNDSDFKGGERKTLTILVANEKPVAKASVVVKILGSSFRPVIFHAKTDADGIAIIHVQLPHFKTGRAAILLKAATGGDEAELRRIVTQG
jgi:hypothetical protein